MKYRHAFHAGNFADVHKHVALLALLSALQLKPRGLLYLDTHAGAGAYDPASSAGERAAEARYGVEALLAAAEPRSSELRAYRGAVSDWRALPDQSRGYPGSPLLAARTLRRQDRAIACEAQPSEYRALQRALTGYRRMHAHSGDGYRALQSTLPPPERRALVLIDPPYEQPREIEQVLAGIGTALARLPNAVIAAWYPIKDERWLSRWQQRLAREIEAPAVALELWIYPRDAGVSLNGSGLLIVNPPYRFDARAREWQPELWAVLDPERRGGCSVHTLVGEREHVHERP
jgi:23S rRNA (adenine2030-N6)-methyltransferase